MIIAKYKFNPSTYENLLPKFNSEFTDYTTSDVNNNDGTITRTIESDSLPTRIKFGYRDDTTNTKVAASSLLEVIELNTDNVNTTRDMFRYCSNLISVNATNWNTSKVTDMGSMFSEASNFNQPLENWDVSSVANMSYMFLSATSFNQPLNNWDVSNVTNMEYMFYDNRIFNQPLASWDVSKVENMGDMFSGSGQNPRPSWVK